MARETAAAGDRRNNASQLESSYASCRGGVLYVPTCHHTYQYLKQYSNPVQMWGGRLFSTLLKSGSNFPAATAMPFTNDDDDDHAWMSAGFCRVLYGGS
jgi:hypothetical protein